MSEKLIGACIFGQSGGPTAVINASAYGVISAALEAEEITKVYGASHGIKGVLDDKLYVMDEEDPEELRLLLHTPSSELGSCRYKIADPETDDTDYKRILEIFEKYNVRYFFYNGGNDSMDTCNKISKYMQRVGYECRIMGIPKTIDNDLMCTDHTPGFGSAAKYVAATVQEIARDSSVYSVKSVTVVEIMGRDAGWLTASTCVLKANDENAPHLIYLPETPFSVERFLEDVKRMLVEHNAVVVAVSEGLKLSDGEYAAEEFQSGHDDAFGHKYLSGIGKCLENIVRKEIGCKVRSIELNLLQRCAGHILSKTDIEESGNLGANAVKLAVAGESGLMSSLTRVSDAPYTVEYSGVDIREVANKEKKIPVEWINEAGNGVKEELITYLTPLVQGEVSSIYENGMPSYLLLK